MLTDVESFVNCTSVNKNVIYIFKKIVFHVFHLEISMYKNSKIMLNSLLSNSLKLLISYLLPFDIILSDRTLIDLGLELKKQTL